jgi:hypothetical protein
LPSTGSSVSSRPVRRLAGVPLCFFLLLSCTSCSRASAAFDGNRALALVSSQTAFGPRVPGTAAHDSCFAWIVDQLHGLTSVVETDTFSYDSPVLKKEVRLMNAVARFNPKSTQRVLYAAHWDSRPWADKDPNLRLRNQPVLGANDGGSGVAVLLEVARVLHKQGSEVGVDLAFLDGEDLGTDTDVNGWFRGSSRYVEWKSGEKPPIFVVVVDMVGQKNAVYHWEGNSARLAMNIVDLVWDVASSIGVRSFRSDVRHTIYDDHIPFLNAGIPAIDIIDFDFPEWHTTHDIPAVVSAQSLEGVGRVLVTIVTRPNFLSH